MATKAEDPHQLNLVNYCVCFLDLLGQRKALEGHGLVHLLSPDGDKAKAMEVVKPIIGPIMRLQSRAKIFLDSMIRKNPNSSLRMKLTPEQREEWDKLQLTRVHTQFWSDGIVSFVSLGDPTIPCPMNGVFGLLGSVGNECLIGLGSKAPLRGGVDIAWGMELQPGALYGAAVARAYELESEVAKYPRVVVSAQTVDFLNAHAYRNETDNAARVNRELAKICLAMIAKDTDGQYFLHYLGDAFRTFAGSKYDETMYNDARKFVVQEKDRFTAAGDTKLIERYTLLLNYFNAHPVKSAASG